jgi:hypothetical protein
MKLLLFKYGIALLLLAITCLQLYFVQTKNLTTWKGGGFGMYSSIHYGHSEIWIRADGLDIWSPIDSLGKLPIGLDNLKKDVFRRPFKANLEKLAVEICSFKKYNSIALEIWQPDLETTSGGFHKHRIHSIKSHAIEP